MKRLRVFTWHVHGSYLYYLSRCCHDIFVPVNAERSPGYGGRGATFDWPGNVHEVPEARVPSLDFDVVLYQSARNWAEDKHRTLSAEQRRLPSIYLEHDPPREHPTDTRHPMDDPDVTLVHVTPFNALMWDSGRCPVRVIEHGVTVPATARWSGRKARGIVVVNNMRTRGRRLGLDIWERVRDEVPLDLVGMDSESVGGLGEVPPMQLAEFVADYRFLFNPIRYTSMGLAVCEAMMIGLPVVGLATTEMATVIQNGVSGYVDTDVGRLVEIMRSLLGDPGEAQRLGDGARQTALARFNVERFADDWDRVLEEVTSGIRTPALATT